MSFLPETEYDVIILGTGTVESIVAGALCRIGKKVLHLDEKDYYGGQYSTLNLDEYSATLQNKQQEPTRRIIQSGEEQVQKHDFSNSTPIRVVYDPSVQTFNSEEAKPDITVDELLSNPSATSMLRKYNLDLCSSKLVLAYGDIVQLLIKSGVGRYLEFRCIDAILMYTENSFYRVPCTKGDIFKDKVISLIEKRYLMKLLELVMSLDNPESESADKKLYLDYENKPFIDFLIALKLSKRLQTFVLYTIALFESEDRSITTKQGIKKMKDYVNSLGRYGTTAFLYPMYGVSEIAQAFCRVGAVYGGTYVLRRTCAEAYVEDSSASTTSSSTESATTVKGIKDSEGQNLLCKYLITSRDYRAADVTDGEKETIQRCITITSQPIFDPAQYKDTTGIKPGTQVGGAIAAIIPPGTFSAEQTSTITITQMDYSSEVAPRDKYVIVFQTRTSNEQVLKQCVEKFIPKEETEIAEKKVVFQVFYKYHVRKQKAGSLYQASNVRVVDDISHGLSMEGVVEEALRIFRSICPTEDFLPRLPNPELDDNPIVYDSASKLLGIDKEVEKALHSSQEEAQNSQPKEAPEEN